MYLFIQSVNQPFFHSFIHSFIYLLFIYLLTYPCIYSCILLFFLTGRNVVKSQHFWKEATVRSGDRQARRRLGRKTNVGVIASRIGVCVWGGGGGGQLRVVTGLEIIPLVEKVDLME